MEQENKHFNILLWDFNNDKLEHHDVLGRRITDEYYADEEWHYKYKIYKK